MRPGLGAWTRFCLTLFTRTPGRRLWDAVKLLVVAGAGEGTGSEHLTPISGGTGGVQAPFLHWPQGTLSSTPRYIPAGLAEWRSSGTDVGDSHILLVTVYRAFCTGSVLCTTGMSSAELPSSRENRSLVLTHIIQMPLFEVSAVINSFPGAVTFKVTPER